MVCYTGCKLHTFYKTMVCYRGCNLHPVYKPWFCKRSANWIPLYKPWFVYGVQFCTHDCFSNHGLYAGCNLHPVYKPWFVSKLRLLYQPWFVYGVQIASLVQFFDVFYHLYKGGFPLYKGIWWRWRKKRGGLGEREDMAGKELQVRVCCAHALRRHTDDCS